MIKKTDLIESETVEYAKSLLGKRLLVKDKQGIISGGIIVETESYLGFIDEACHSYNHNKTPRLASLYKEKDTVYIYSMHRQLLLNLIPKPSEAVLIRAIQPTINLKSMIERRDKTGINLSNGPGKLTQALGIYKEMDGTRLGELIRIEDHHDLGAFEIESSPRIGIEHKGEWTHKLLRFYVKDNPYVSQMKRSPSFK